ncbi:TRAP transporter small permease [Pelagimonas varians]|uniref:TRAP transporter small permease protein n=1 Tax=Pelagimonas varians TaxID=696760 RepID=A0A238L4R1_9RHOB|nr:TRAP transporter small permease [Pelagimonas varians]PYG26401.1 TRAP-type C4-dicarboxylate transport system permease small subunit [Pelagimonas varians]SMX49987.1 Tripartite ATP-independent periplasmic transporters, DctQ component [Pelagimonas varians]
MDQETAFVQQARLWLDRLSGLCILIASCALVVLVATFGWLVFGRYVLNVTPTWVEQLALLLVCYIAYLGAAAGVHENTHLGVTLFRDALPETLRKVVLIGTDILLAFFGFLMAIASLELFQFGWDTMLPMLNIPESFRTLSALLCGGLVFIFSGMRALFRIHCLSTGKPFEIDEVT